ncbi:AAA family ATPase [candidate division WOR-3 bacterium]|nr:AAA family ATPase [candidate division WOR-3 bacterium]
MDINIGKDFENAHPGIWLLVGLVGAGKTTFAQHLWSVSPDRTIRSSLDEIIQMMSFYNYEPKMHSFYIGVERTSIIDGLINGYKVVVDRTNITRSIRGQFISLVTKMKEIAKRYLKLYDTVKEDTFIERCERDLIESILIEESREIIDIYSSFLKLVRNWKAKRKEPELFPEKSPSIRKNLKDITEIEIVCVYFDIPFKICLMRRIHDPFNILRDRVKKVDWKAVIKKMERQLEPPTINENFDRIYTVDHTGKVTRKTL